MAFGVPIDVLYGKAGSLGEAGTTPRGEHASSHCLESTEEFEPDAAGIVACAD